MQKGKTKDQLCNSKQPQCRTKGLKYIMLHKHLGNILDSVTNYLQSTMLYNTIHDVHDTGDQRERAKKNMYGFIFI